MSDDEETVYVPRRFEYDDDTPLGVEGDVVTVLHSQRSSRRITLLVEEKAERAEHSEDVPERVDPADIDEMGYRDLQSLAKELDIKANQSEEILTDEILSKLD